MARINQTGKKMRKLLIVEDDTAILGQLTHALSKTYEVKGATDRVAALEVLGGCGYKPDAVVLDLGLPPFEDTTAEGIELMNWIHSNTRAKVIVLTGQKSREAALESVKTGTFDYLMKPVDPARLLFSIERAFLRTPRKRWRRAVTTSFRLL
jgi:DNA-binding NtrC family response regulator